MKIIFIGGSREISRLPSEVQVRIDNIISGGHEILVGDAHGADTAVQKHLIERGYRNVTVFFSGYRPRNNVGQWKTHLVATGKITEGYQFRAAKDREMSLLADCGLMVWDGKSPGTL